MKFRFLEDDKVARLRENITGHALYGALGEMENLRVFMEHHVFAVWDFMSIVKALQLRLTGMHLPWTPPKDVEAARLINEIVLGEESDRGPDGACLSHFELYLNAMREIGADVTVVCDFVARLEKGEAPEMALAAAGAPQLAREFVAETLDLLRADRVHALAAALFYGRENLIPAMFQPMIEELHAAGSPCGVFLYYLERHVHLDGGEHSEWAESLLARLCEGDAVKREEARATAVRVLQARLRFWDGVFAFLPSGAAATAARQS